MSVRSVQNMTLYGAGVSSSLAPSSDLVGDFEPIATVTVGSGGASSIEFTSIPGTYQHLQIRSVGRCNYVGGTVTPSKDINIRVNGDSGNNYVGYHLLYGNGASAAAAGYGTLNRMPIGSYALATTHALANHFHPCVIDILDYASTTKNKTFRAFSGGDENGSGSIALTSSLWMNTSAITSLTLFEGSSNTIVQHSTFALYGVRA